MAWMWRHRISMVPRCHGRSGSRLSSHVMLLLHLSLHRLLLLMVQANTLDQRGHRGWCISVRGCRWLQLGGRGLWWLWWGRTTLAFVLYTDLWFTLSVIVVVVVAMATVIVLWHLWVATVELGHVVLLHLKLHGLLLLVVRCHAHALDERGNGGSERRRRCRRRRVRSRATHACGELGVIGWVGEPRRIDTSLYLN